MRWFGLRRALLLSLLVQKYIVRGLTMGAVK